MAPKKAPKIVGNPKKTTVNPTEVKKEVLDLFNRMSIKNTYHWDNGHTSRLSDMKRFLNDFDYNKLKEGFTEYTNYPTIVQHMRKNIQNNEWESDINLKRIYSELHTLKLQPILDKMQDIKDHLSTETDGLVKRTLTSSFIKLFNQLSDEVQKLDLYASAFASIIFCTSHQLFKNIKPEAKDTMYALQVGYYNNLGIWCRASTKAVVSTDFDLTDIIRFWDIHRSNNGEGEKYKSITEEMIEQEMFNEGKLDARRTRDVNVWDMFESIESALMNRNERHSLKVVRIDPIETLGGPFQLDTRAFIYDPLRNTDTCCIHACLIAFCIAHEHNCTTYKKLYEHLYESTFSNLKSSIKWSDLTDKQKLKSLGLSYLTTHKIKPLIVILEPRKSNYHIALKGTTPVFIEVESKRSSSDEPLVTHAKLILNINQYNKTKRFCTHCELFVPLDHTCNCGHDPSYQATNTCLFCKTQFSCNICLMDHEIDCATHHKNYRDFSSAEVSDLLSSSKTVESYMRCRNTLITVSKKTKYCRNCGNRHLPTERCLLKASHTLWKDETVYVYDIESLRITESTNEAAKLQYSNSIYYKDNMTHMTIPDRVALMQLGSRVIYMFSGVNCLLDMIYFINSNVDLNLYSHKVRYIDEIEYIIYEIDKVEHSYDHRKSRRCYVYAHNGARFDNFYTFHNACISNIFVDNIILKGNAVVSFNCGKAIFHDSILHLPGALSTWGKLLGRTQKTEFNYDDYTLDRLYDSPYMDSTFIEVLDDYLYHDIIILYELIEFYIEFWKSNFNYNPIKHCTIAGSAKALYMNRFYKDEFELECTYLNKDIQQLLSDAFHGGLTNVTKFRPQQITYTEGHYYRIHNHILRFNGVNKDDPFDDPFTICDDYTGDDIIEHTHEYYYLDYTSMYPYILHELYLPLQIVYEPNVPTPCVWQDVDDPSSITDIINSYILPPSERPPSDDPDDTVYAVFAKVDLVFDNKSTLFSPIVAPIDGKLIETLIDGTYTTTGIELYHFLKLGHITKIHKMYLFVASNELFKEYIDKLFELKTLYDDVPAKRNMCKLILNSLWGKLSEKTKLSKCELIRDNQSYSLFRDNICAKRYECLNCIDTDDFTLVKVRTPDTSLTTRNEVNIFKPRTSAHVGVYVTAHGRMKLYSDLLTYAPYICMHDTDSMIACVPKGLKVDYSLTGTLGQFKNECPEGLVLYLGFAPKSYIIMYISHGKVVTTAHCKGFDNKKMKLIDYLTILNGGTFNEDPLSFKLIGNCVYVDNRKKSVKLNYRKKLITGGLEPNATPIDSTAATYIIAHDIQTVPFGSSLVTPL